MSQQSAQLPESQEPQERILRRAVRLRAIWAGFFVIGFLELAFLIFNQLSMWLALVLCGIPFFGTITVGSIIISQARRRGDREEVVIGIFATLLSPLVLILLILLMIWAFQDFTVL